MKSLNSKRFGVNDSVMFFSNGELKSGVIRGTEIFIGQPMGEPNPHENPLFRHTIVCIGSNQMEYADDCKCFKDKNEVIEMVNKFKPNHKSEKK